MSQAATRPVVHALRTHPAVRLTYGREADGSWRLDHLEQRRSFRVSTPVVLAVLANADAPATETALARVRSHTAMADDVWQSLLTRLVANDILVPSDFRTDHPMSAVLPGWEKASWARAADYVWATYDYPFLDYSERAARETDMQRMRDYVQEAADSVRTKSYPRAGVPTINCPHTGDALRELDVALDTAVFGAAPPAALDGEHLRLLLSVAFGKLRARRLRDPGRAPLIRRTSPSGGSRHPTEGYVSVADVVGMPDGLFHFSTTEYVMVRIGEPLPTALVGCAPSDPSAIVIATSVFERNMYRYREPRTFRTICLDVGHVVGTIEISARAAGLSAERLYIPDYQAVDSALGIDSLTEGTICAVRAGGGGT